MRGFNLVLTCADGTSVSDSILLAVAANVASHWAGRGGPRSEIVIACRDGEVLAIAEMAISKRWDDAGRRAALGALVPLTACGSFGYVADSTITVDGESGDALLCLELVIIDAAARVVGAQAHIARYTRTKKRFGNDVIDLAEFTELASPAYGELVGELAAVWHLEGDRGRLGAMNILSETGVEMSDLHPALQADLERLLAQHA
jgi:hypothetical protein